MSSSTSFDSRPADARLATAVTNRIFSATAGFGIVLSVAAAGIRSAVAAFGIVATVATVGIVSTVAPVAIAGSSSVVPPSHLVVCPATLAPSFAPLVSHRTQTGTPSALVLYEDILASTPAGRDDAETLRNYLAYVRGEGSVRYVLLAGGATLLPARRVRNTFYPGGGYTDLPTDLYYAALDGDWDGDGDGVLGEPYQGASDPGDNADLDPDIAVGRAPVTSAAQADRFVQAVLTYEHPGQGGHVGSALLLAEVLFPADWSGGTPVLDGAAYTQTLRTHLLGLPTPVSSLRLYENFTVYSGAQLLSPASAVAAMGSGQHGTLYCVAHGTLDSFSAGSGVVTLAQIDALTNAPNYFVAVCQWGNGGDFTGDAVLNHLVTAPGGGAVAAMGFTGVVFPATASAYVEDFFLAATAPQGARIGDAQRAVLHDHAIDTSINTSSRWTSMSMVLLGDPATPHRTEVGPVATATSSVGGLKRAFK